MIEIAGTVATVLAVAGVVFNNRLDRRCFVLWIVSNIICAAVHLQAGIWSLLARDVIFAILAVEGLILWGRHS